MRGEIACVKCHPNRNDDLNDGLESFCPRCGRETPECICEETLAFEFGEGPILEEIIDEVWDPAWGHEPDEDLPNIPGD